MYKNYFGIAAILFGAGYFIQSLPFAQAFPQGPNVSMSANPYESFTGSTSGTVDLLTVPNDQIFIVTTCVSNSSYVDLKENNDTIITGSSSGCMSGALHDGNGHLVIASGSTLKVQSTYGTRYYYIEGYYAHP